MPVTDPPTEEELASAFRVDPNLAIELIFTHYREPIIRRIKRVTWGQLDPDELEDAWQETVLAFTERSRRAGFDPQRPLRLVYAIALNKGIDILRFNHAHRVNTNADAILDLVAADLRNSELGLRHARMEPTEEREFREALLEIIQTLPKRQRTVTRCFVDHFEDFRERNTYQLLAQEVSLVTGETERVAAVKSAWHSARKNIRAALVQRGYSSIFGE